MPRYTEQSTQLSLALTEDWETRVGENPAAPFIARMPLTQDTGFSIVITVESPPSHLQKLDAYAQKQISDFQASSEISSYQLLGKRVIRFNEEEAVLASQLFVQDDSELCNVQVFILHNNIATVLTVTGPLGLLDGVYLAAQEVLTDFSPAQDVYRYEK